MKSTAFGLALGIAGCTLAVGSACGSDWKDFASGDDARYYIDVESIKTTNEYLNYKQAWIRTDYLLKQKDGERSGKHLVVARCKEREFALTYEAYYAGVSGSGDILRSGGLTPSYSPAIPDTIGEALADAICSGQVAQSGDAG